ncbi:MAG: hypothetical protein ACYC0B_03200 [Gemmatimonadaceae bacterium]
MRTATAPRATSLLLASLVLLASACDSPDAAATDVVRTDSSNVRIVLSTAADRDLPWTFEQVEVMRDSAGEPWLFNGLHHRGVLADRAGRVYVVTRDPSIVRFGREGRHDRTIGRKGGGPGEMQYPSDIGAQVDTLFVRDIVKGALVRWSSALEPVTDVRLDGAFAGEEAIAFRSGGFWMQKKIYSDTLITNALFADTAGGAALHSTSVRPSGMIDFGCVKLSGMAPVFAPTLIWSANGPRVVVNATAAYEIWMHEGARVTASVRRAIPTRAPSAADVEALHPGGMKVAFLGAGSAECVIPAKQLMAKLGVAEKMPLINDMQYLSDGTIWVQRSLRGAAEPVLDVFIADGSYAGTMRGMGLPLGLMPNGDILFARDDEDTGGVHMVRMKVIKRPPASP